MRHSSKKSKESKMKELLLESEDWETGRKGRNTTVAHKNANASLDQKLELQMVSIRLPIQAVEKLKHRAAAKGIGYQPYIRQLIMNHLMEESLEVRLQRIEKTLYTKSG